jgi:hypothetical protein
MSTVTISKVSNPTALYCKYASQLNPQPCYVELDCDKETLSASYNGEVGNAVPFTVYHGHDQRWGIPCLTADAVNEFMEEILPLAQKIVDGYESIWNGHNHVADFTEDAQEAIEEIESKCDELERTTDESNTVQVWNISEWITDTVKATTSDDDLQKMIDDAEPCENNIVIEGDIEEYLKNLRSEKRVESIEALLDDLDTVQEYKSTDDSAYWVLFSNQRIAQITYDEDGKVKWIPTKLKSDSDLADTAIGRAYATAFLKEMYSKYTTQAEHIKRWLDGTTTASNEVAAKCEGVPDKFRSACRDLAIIELKKYAQQKLEEDNPQHFEVKKVTQIKTEEITVIEKEIESLHSKINSLTIKMQQIKNSFPSEPHRHLSFGSNGYYQRFYNLTGEYPKLDY